MPAVRPVTVAVLPAAASDTDPVPVNALQVPPAVLFDKVVVLPTHTLDVPVIAAGVGFTVMVLLVKFTQPALVTV